MSASVRPPRVVNIADLRRIAKRRLPQVVFDYIDGGADSEITLRENCHAFDTVDIPSPHAPSRRRRAICARRSLASRCRCRILLAPVGSSRMFYPRGEEVAARAAGVAGTAYILSTLVWLPDGRCRRGVQGPGLLPAVPARRT